MDIKKAVAFGKFSGLESPQRILADRVIELERELATQHIINKRSCDEWAHDHTYLQNLCRMAGYDEHTVEGNRYGIRSIGELGDMLIAKIPFHNSEQLNK